MNTSFKMGVCAVAFMLAMPAAMACATEKKQIRTDRVSVSQGISQFDINPFADSKRVVRNDRVSYLHPKVQNEVAADAEDEVETVAVEKHRYVRSDHIIVNK